MCIVTPVKNMGPFMNNTVLVGCLLLLLMGCSQSLQCAETPSQPTKPCVLLLLGAPGSGRATLAVKASSALSLPYISFAQLLQEETEASQNARDYVNRGAPIPDELLFQLLLDRTQKEEYLNGFLLDDFPKTVKQAKMLQQYLEKEYLFIVALINVSEEWLTWRTEGRMICHNCGRVYHNELSPPQNETHCDICNNELSQREADSKEIIKEQLQNYFAETGPVIDFYKQEKLLIEIDGDKVFEKLFAEITQVIPQIALASNNTISGK